MAKLRTGGVALALAAATLMATPANATQAAPTISVTAMNVHLRQFQTIAGTNGGYFVNNLAAGQNRQLTTPSPG